MKRFLTILVASTITGLCPIAYGDDEMAVDSADDFNPESFHKSKPSEIKVFDSASGKFFSRGVDVDADVADSKEQAVKKVYLEQDRPKNSDHAPSTTTLTAPSPASSTALTNAASTSITVEALDVFDNTEYPVDTGKRYEIRTRYTLKPGNSASLSADAATDIMHGKMAQQCPQGWEKQREWSLPVEGDYYLHYQFECL